MAGEASRVGARKGKSSRGRLGKIKKNHSAGSDQLPRCVFFNNG